MGKPLQFWLWCKAAASVQNIYKHLIVCWTPQDWCKAPSICLGILENQFSTEVKVNATMCPVSRQQWNILIPVICEGVSHTRQRLHLQFCPKNAAVSKELMIHSFVSPHDEEQSDSETWSLEFWTHGQETLHMLNWAAANRDWIKNDWTHEWTAERTRCKYWLSNVFYE